MTLDMHPEIRAQWCAALRSGDYQQGCGSLRFGDTFCCLGVLCDLAVTAGVIPAPVQLTDPEDPDGKPGSWAYDGCPDYLPMSVQGWAGLDMLTPRVPGGDYLANLNDSGVPFTAIADIIEGGTP